PQLLEKIQKADREESVENDVATVEALLEISPLPLKIIGESASVKNVLSLAHRVAASPFPVLLLGETGTGKDLVARLIHLLSPRRDLPFIEVNCAAIPEHLFESELFGHEKGSFTGAVNLRRGRFELANGGTLFLDEIGDMPLFLQPKILRALQEKKISRIGSEKNIDVDVRLISATNRNLKVLCESGHFREDVYFRIKVLEIELPPLRDRREDIPALADFFLERCTGRACQFSKEALDILIKYPFPGNVRELENIVQRSTTLARGSVIMPEDLPQEVRHYCGITQGTLIHRLEAVEREMLLSSLEKCGWVQTRAAEVLGISERVLRYKMKKYGIKNKLPQ
ncbi:MAG: sigma-54 dependent transcriptional regulator, partial [Pseudomonadota bacterium]